MKETSYWLEALPVAISPTQSDLPEQCEVAVIGGGLTGLSTALHLARQGVNVAVLEREKIGWGASTRNAGMALTGLKLSPEHLVQKFGRALARQFFQASLDALDFVERLVALEKIDCEFRRCGDLCVAFRPAHFDSMQASRKFLQEQFGHETFLVPPAEMRREIGSKFYHGGLVDPLSASLNPAKLLAGLAKAARQASAMLHEKTLVKRCHRTDHGFSIETSRGHLKAKEIVAATNGYTPPSWRFLRRRIIPIGSYIIVTEPMEKPLAEALIPQNRMVYDTKNFLFYFRRTPDDRLLFGGRTSFVPTTNRAAARILQQAMQKVFPQLEQVKIEYAWQGNVGFTFDQMPHLGEHEGIHYAMGYCGHGVVMSIYFGSWLARMIGGERCELPFTRLSFPARFFYRRRPWFLPLAGTYFKILDRLF